MGNIGTKAEEQAGMLHDSFVSVLVLKTVVLQVP